MPERLAGCGDRGPPVRGGRIRGDGFAHELDADALATVVGVDLDGGVAVTRGPVDLPICWSPAIA